MIEDSETLGKHYTSTEKTGLSSSEEKEKSVLLQLQLAILNNVDKAKPWLRRYELRLLIAKAFDRPIDKSTVYSFINYLLTQGFIEQNPDSHITVNDNILPDNMTKYFLKAEVIDLRQSELYAKKYNFIKAKGKFPLSVTLDSFKKTNSQSQEEKKSIAEETH